ncbi:hypothetical protein ACJX0J_022683 [Zea mays]
MELLTNLNILFREIHLADILSLEIRGPTTSQPYIIFFSPQSPIILLEMQCVFWIWYNMDIYFLPKSAYKKCHIATSYFLLLWLDFEGMIVDFFNNMDMCLNMLVVGQKKIFMGHKEDRMRTFDEKSDKKFECCMGANNILQATIRQSIHQSLSNINVAVETNHLYKF